MTVDTNELIYMNPSCSTDERAADLLSRMSIDEKVGQMCQVDGRNDPERWIKEKHVGSFLHVIGEVTNEFQAMAAETRLGIPLIFGIDAIHGHAFWPEATVFPTQLAQSSSWNPDLVEKIGRVTAVETTLTGLHWTFSPVLGVARDLRWGRIDETFGEDPYLVGILGAALIRGYQGDDLSAEHALLACAKHFAGYPASLGGRDSYEAELTERNLRSLYFKPFQEAVKAGCATFMAGYQAIDGVPCSANRWLMQEVLKDEWGFEGFSVTDWDNVGRLHREQKVSATMAEAATLAILAGNDLIMTTPSFYDEALQLHERGKLPLEVVDEACRRILRLKFELGLFDEKRFVDMSGAGNLMGCDEHRRLALEAAYESIVLLKNDSQILPLSPKISRIALIGPNADDELCQLGDWTFPNLHDAFSRGKGEEHLATLSRPGVVTLLQGIKNRLPSSTEITYVRGCGLLNAKTVDIPEAVAAAKKAEVAIVVVGDSPLQNGELRDRANLDLSGGQQLLLEAIHETGTPMVVVLINGKPLSMPWLATHADAIVEAWNPGCEGGTAVAGLLFGDRNPSAKLAISFPYHVGQQPVYYNQMPGWHADRYCDMPSEPLFAFGFGLSYTSYGYSNLAVMNPLLKRGEALRLQIEVENRGKRPGTEIVQLYINDIYSSVTTPVKELKAFRRVPLNVGEKKTVQFDLPFDQLSLVNQQLQTVVEAGDFEVMVGSSSRDRDLLRESFTVLDK